ncbi:MAG: hypothetical protein HC880_16800 [Bacteroidia bacterium]|nr:hypothetical protein [Bacteroidia bacterium]
MKKKSYFLYLLLAFGLSNCIGVDVIQELEPAQDMSRLEISGLTSGELFTNQTVQLTAAFLDMLGNAASANLSWNSSNPVVATIDGNGTLTTLGLGQTTITAIANQTVRDSVQITVIANPNASLSIQATKSALIPGDTTQFIGIFRDSNGQIQNNVSITWTSSNSAVLSINQNGVATALIAGSAEVTASAQGTNSNPFMVVVQAEPTTAASRSGTFQGLNGYRAEGTATLREVLGSNNLSLEFASNFRTSNGPGLFVYLSNSATSVNGGVELVALKSTSGTQTYEIPNNVSLNSYNFVVIFCRPFRVSFGAAELK